MVHSILVVCIGNICRSPMAACLLGHVLPACEVVSAGLAPPVGAPADPNAVRLLAREGFDIVGHRARAVDDALVAAADLILVMDSEQRDELERVFPHARGKTHRLCEYTHTDVPDPYGCSPKMFGIVLELIKQGIASWSIRLGAAAAPAHVQGEAS
ncbi:low molecular weight protein-tyrosine-phosphatase [Cupriavidus sp. GA3-3]|uniref:low molecular weight protein-tyrosine-phosphatase n=1 Tax=Cupriavidus sp. GA3-3 TaxID=1229514 RepID=UPI0003A29C13|nr:low molecular weight protein-tyrosine-phosphatase [Cupriavidus sp. GA3-3]